MKRSKKIAVALLLSVCMLFGSVASVAYAEEAQNRMLYFSNYYADLHIEDDGRAFPCASLNAKCLVNSSSIMLILQRQIGDSWGYVTSWYVETNEPYADIAEQCRVSRGTYRCVGTFTINTDSGSETREMISAERTY